MRYALNLSVFDAERLGVTKEKYDETITRIKGLNDYIQERLDSGDVVQCLPPPAQETKTLIRYDDERYLLLGMYDVPTNNQYAFYYLMAPKTICAYITASSFYYAVTISLDGGGYSANYTITGAQTDPSNSAHITHPGNGLPLPEGQEQFSDYYNTHDWSFSTTFSGYLLPNFTVYLTLHRRFYNL